LTDIDDIEAKGWGKTYLPEGSPERVSVPEFGLLADYVSGGGGYGDPLDRNVEAVVQDLRAGITSPEVARNIYGVIVDASTLSLDHGKTEERRREIREQRLKEGRRPASAAPQAGNGADWNTILRIHEYLEIARNGSTVRYRCTRCGHLFCSPEENYKKHCLKRVVTLDRFALRPLPTRGPYLGHLQEYICPGCATLLQVDVYCPALGGEEDLWDIRIDSPERT
ncbi:MAG: hypothetical protein HYV04_02925, partial [Deltaproteobacteria bacterium]|nr:hypothetical protein [Deltaproteobacteria bacterium]